MYIITVVFVHCLFLMAAEGQEVMNATCTNNTITHVVHDFENGTLTIDSEIGLWAVSNYSDHPEIPQPSPGNLRFAELQSAGFGEMEVEDINFCNDYGVISFEYFLKGTATSLAFLQVLRNNNPEDSLVTLQAGETPIFGKFEEELNSTWNGLMISLNFIAYKVEKADIVAFDDIIVSALNDTNTTETTSAVEVTTPGVTCGGDVQVTDEKISFEDGSMGDLAVISGDWEVQDYIDHPDIPQPPNSERFLWFTSVSTTGRMDAFSVTFCKNYGRISFRYFLKGTPTSVPYFKVLRNNDPTDELLYVWANENPSSGVAEKEIFDTWDGGSITLNFYSWRGSQDDVVIIDDVIITGI